jgi:hypothetical protein
MKKITIILSLAIISLNSWGEWTYVTNNSVGTSFYLDKDSIKKRDKYIYFWSISNYGKPILDKYNSGKTFNKVDCGIYRQKMLDITLYTKPSGQGDFRNIPVDDKWDYLSPESSGGMVLDFACNHHPNLN